jgi:mRNA interferase HicA
MKRRDLIKTLVTNGFRIVRDDGKHTIYEAPNKRAIQDPRHREISENTAKQILKDAGLK